MSWRLKTLNQQLRSEEVAASVEEVFTPDIALMYSICFNIEWNKSCKSHRGWKWREKRSSWSHQWYNKKRGEKIKAHRYWQPQRRLHYISSMIHIITVDEQIFSILQSYKKNDPIWAKKFHSKSWDRGL